MTLRGYYLQLKPEEKRGFIKALREESRISEPTIRTTLRGAPIEYATAFELLAALKRLDIELSYNQDDVIKMCRGEVVARKPRKVRQWGKK